MVNKAISERIETKQEKRNQDRKEFEETKKEKALQPKPAKGFPKILTQMCDQSNYITFLHSYDKGIALSVHKYWEDGRRPGQKGRYKFALCRKDTYAPINPDLYKDCKYCDMPGFGGKNNKPVFLRAFLGYVHNKAGKTFTPDGQKQGEEITYPLNPVSIIEVRYGSGSSTINGLIEFVRKGLFNKKIYEQRKTGKGIETEYKDLCIADPDVMGEEIQKVVPAAILAEYAAMDEDQIAQRILNGYEGVLWEEWVVAPPSAPVEEEAKEPATAGASKAALSRKTSG